MVPYWSVPRANCRYSAHMHDPKDVPATAPMHWPINLEDITTEYKALIAALLSVKMTILRLYLC